MIKLLTLTHGSGRAVRNFRPLVSPCGDVCLVKYLILENIFSNGARYKNYSYHVFTSYVPCFFKKRVFTFYFFTLKHKVHFYSSNAQNQLNVK